MSKDFLLVLLVLGISLFLGFCFRQAFPKIEKQIQSDTVTVTKTVTVEVPKVVYRTGKAVIETVFVEKGVQDVVARLDTVANKDTISVKYHFPPLNFFDLRYAPAPRDVQIVDHIVTNTVQVEKGQFLGGYPEKILYFLGGYGACTIIHH